VKLLYARSDDHKSHKFGKSQRDHDTKLIALPLLWLFINNLSRVDPRKENELAYAQALAIGLRQLKTDGNVVLEPFREEEGFTGLNKWKQRGFYATVNGDAFITPREAVDQQYAKAVHRFAWRAINTLDFVLKDGNLERYIEQARSIRGKLAEGDHKALEQIGQRAAEIIFGLEDAPPCMSRKQHIEE
jgi:AbiV family abortive infection protein